jgi:hypothetical protein
MKKLKNLYDYIKANGFNNFKPVVDVDVNFLYLKDNKGTKIFYVEESDSFKIKCRIKCIKDDNSITFLDNPICMDLFAKDKTDVLSILKSKY